MVEPSRYGDVEITRDGHVAIAEIRRPPNNFFDVDLINALVQAFRDLDDDPKCRAIVLCSEGKHFCAGNDFSRSAASSERTQRNVTGGNPLYSAAVDLFSCKKPVVGAIQGAAVGGGF
ncbi:MAG TPA: enoyl-CoA hydratase/isomerase family protein, partial [Gammaproteobacteria bacterium]|nr:enoyl-CoA hydratase/isomerase family protein [Gammaproteobacteria bacterium]